MADQQDHYNFASEEGREMVADRERGWQRFTRLIVWSIGAIVAVLLAMLLFLA